MPAVTSLEALNHAADRFEVTHITLAIEPSARAAVQWLGDGRITAGHLAVLRDRAKAGPFGLILFDQIMRSTSTWSERDEAMAGPVLASCEANGTTLVVAGNAHTPTRPTAPDPQDRTRKTGPARPDPQGRTPASRQVDIGPKRRGCLPAASQGHRVHRRFRGHSRGHSPGGQR